jgi:hypothetical protein
MWVVTEEGRAVNLARVMRLSPGETGTEVLAFGRADIEELAWYLEEVGSLRQRESRLRRLIESVRTDTPVRVTMWGNLAPDRREPPEGAG